jgi:hypothetical protein
MNAMPRKSLLISVLASVTVLLATFSAIAMRAKAHHTPNTAALAAAASLRQPGSAQSSSAQPSLTQPISAQPASAQPVRTGPPGAALHTVAKGESLPGIVHRYLPRTHFMTGSGLEEAIRAANPGVKGISPRGIWPKPGSELVIPSYQESWTERPVPVAKDFEVRAIYLTGTMAGSARGLEIIRKWREAGGNSVVFDIKDSDGSVSVPTGLPLAPEQKSYPIRNLPKFTAYLHSLGMHGIARIAIFRDEALVAAHPELAVQSRSRSPQQAKNGLAGDPAHTMEAEVSCAI